MTTREVFGRGRRVERASFVGRPQGGLQLEEAFLQTGADAVGAGDRPLLLVQPIAQEFREGRGVSRRALGDRGVHLFRIGRMCARLQPRRDGKAHGRMSER